MNESAFGQPAEAALVDSLRNPSFISLVAIEEGQVVGHILFTPVSVEDQDSRWTAMALAPMAVDPTHQNAGVGSRLVLAGLEECRRTGNLVVFVLGHEHYYPRFGFVPAQEKGIRCEFEVPPQFFMVTELEPDALQGRRGLVRYAPEFSRI